MIPYQCQTDGRIMTRHLTPGQHYHESQPDSMGRVTFTPVEQRWVEVTTPTPVDQVAEMAAKLEPDRVCGNCDYFVAFFGLYGKCIHPTPGTSDGITSRSFTCPHHQPREEG